MTLAARSLAMLVAAVVAAALAAAALAEGDMTQPSPGQCDTHQAAALLTTRALIVYRTAAGTNRFSQSVARYWACARPDGAPVKLGRNASGGTHPPAETTTLLAAAGSYVGALQSSRRGYAQACPPVGRKSCPRYHHQVVLIDPAASDSATFSCGAHVGRLLVGAGANRGVLVWTQPAGRSRIAVSDLVLRSPVQARSYGSSEAGGGLVAQGAIVPGSLRLTGMRLRFIEAGRPHSVSLARS